MWKLPELDTEYTPNKSLRVMAWTTASQLNLGKNSHIEVEGRECRHWRIDHRHEPTLENRKAHHIGHLIQYEDDHRCKRYRLGYNVKDFFRYNGSAI